MQGKRSLTLPRRQLCPSAVGEGSALGSPAPTKGNMEALQSSWRELQNAAGRAGTAGPHPAQLCHGAGLRREVSEAQERAGRKEDAVGRVEPVTTYEGHVLPPPAPTGTCKAARASEGGRRHRRVNAASRLGNCSRGRPGTVAQERPHTDTGKSNLHSQPLRPPNRTLSSAPSSGGTDERRADPPIPPPSHESIHLYLRLPCPGGDAMVGAGEEELRANNSNRNRVEPFQLFICQMDSFPALFFFLQK